MEFARFDVVKTPLYDRLEESHLLLPSTNLSVQQSPPTGPRQSCQRQNSAPEDGQNKGHSHSQLATWPWIR